MLPCNLNLNVEKSPGDKDKILISNIDMKFGSNRDSNEAVLNHEKPGFSVTYEMHLMINQ